MRHTRFLSLLAFAGALFAQGTASLQFTQSFTNTTTGAVVSNGPTLAGGPQGSVGFRLVYYIQPGSGTVSALSVELDGAATQLGSYTALTPAPGGGSGSSPSTNPATTSPQGQNNLCCDFYPFLHIKVNTFTVATGSPILIVKVLGYAGTSAAANSGSGGGGGGLTCLNGDVLAGTGSCTSAEVVGLEGVPFCSGFTPTNGQFLKYTTGGSPNPCYTAAASITGGICTTGQFVSAITAAGVITCGTPAGGGTIATTTNALVGDGAGNAIAASGTGTNCLLVNGGNQACGGGGGGSGGNGLTVYSGLAEVALSNATLYFPVGGGSLASSTETNVDALMESSGTISAFGASLSVALGTTIATNNTVVLTWRKNATGQTLTCTITNPATSCSDITHSFTYAAGDLLTIQAVFTGTISAAPVWVMSALAGGTSSGGSVAQPYATIGGTVAGPVYAVTPPPPSGWTWLNQGSSAVTVSNAALHMSWEADSSNICHGYLQASPGATFTVTVGGTQNLALNTVGNGIGIALFDSVSGNSVVYYVGQQNNANIYAVNYNSSFAISSVQIGPVGVGATSPMWLRLVEDATHRTFFYSIDGIVFRQIGQVAAGTYIVPTHVGIGTDGIVFNSTTGGDNLIFHFKLTTP